MRILLLIGGVLCASTMALADSPGIPTATQPTVHHQEIVHCCDHGYIMFRDRCGQWRTGYRAYPQVRYETYPSATFGTRFPFRHRPYIDSSRFPRFQSWTAM